MKTIYAFKAQPVGSSTPEALTVIIKDELPATEKAEQSMEYDARRIASALWNSLPGGTVDRLCAELLRRQASRLHVAHREASA